MWNWEKCARASGAIFAVLATAGFLIAGETPKVSDSGDAVVAYLETNRSEVIVGALVFAASFVFFIWFAGAIANHLRAESEGRVGATVLSAGAALAGVQIVVAAMFAALAYSIAGGGEPALTKALYDFDLGLDILAGLAVGLFVLGTSIGLRRTASIPSWLAWAGVVVAVMQFLRATTWARDGLWSPSGEYALITVASSLLWVAVASIAFARRAPASEHVPGAASAMVP